MKTSISNAADSPQNQLQVIWTWINRRRLLVGAAAILVLGLALGWNWLAAIGALQLLWFLPCALMLGMCMKGMRSNNGGNSCSQSKQTTENPPSAGSADSASTGVPGSLPGPSFHHIEEKDHV